MHNVDILSGRLSNSAPVNAMRSSTPASLYSFSSTEKLSTALRQYLIQQQNNAIEKHGCFRVAVSGGSLPKILSQALLEQPSVKFSKWQIFFADERCVSLSDADSNYKLLHDELLSKLPSTASEGLQVHTINPGLISDYKAAAEDYISTLRSSFTSSSDDDGTPVFDLLLLGCGPDGHTCSLFPSHRLLAETNSGSTPWVLGLDDSPKPPPSRITLSLPVVLAARNIAFVATGEGKKDVLKKIFDDNSGEGGDLPCGIVNKSAKGRVEWFVDDKAVDGVDYQRSHL